MATPPLHPVKKPSNFSKLLTTKNKFLDTVMKNINLLKRVKLTLLHKMLRWLLQYKNKKFWEKLIVYFLLIWHEPHRKWHPTILLLVGVFVLVGTFLLSYCLAMMRRHKDTKMKRSTQKPISVFSKQGKEAKTGSWN